MPGALLRNIAQPPRAIKAIKDAICRGQTFLKADATLILVCGKHPDPSSPGGRDRILHYAKNHLRMFQFFIAEEIFDLFRDKGDLDLLSLEEKLIDFCDCIIIVLESESAFAELGAFAIKTELAENILVINAREFRESESFIALGPLAKVNRVSRFRPIIHVDLRSVLRAAPELSKRLAAIERKRNRRIDLRSGSEFDSLSGKIRMLFVLDTITFFQPVTLREIAHILTEYYGAITSKVSLDVHLLQALKLAELISGHYVRPIADQRLFLQYHGLKENLVRADVINHYHKYAKDRVEILRQRVGITNAGVTG